MSQKESLPESVLNLLNSSRFIHLATCLDNKPHVSLMNYVCSSGDDNVVIVSTPRKTTKFENMLSNPNVSLLIHDWISVKNTAGQSLEEPSASPKRNSLYELLANFNRNELSRVSVMLDGEAKILDKTVDGRI